MSTLIRITISVILFAILFCYEWLHIKKEILNHEKNETFFTEYDYSFTKKQYIIFAAICYSILNITIISLFIFVFPDYIFLSTRKLFLIGGLILAFIFTNLSFYYGVFDNSFLKETFFSILAALTYVLFLIAFIIPSIGNVEIGKHESTKTMYLITRVYKFKDTNNENMYLITFKEEEPLILKEKDVKEFNISTDTFVSCNTVTTYFENPEKKEKDESEEPTNTYEISVDSSLFYEYTKKWCNYVF